MELRHLKAFVSVAENLHFGRAASQLHLVQSAVSQQIQLLETDLGVRLFARTRQRVALTPAGSAFLPEARRTLAQAQTAARLARAAGEGTVGCLELGFVDNAIWTALPAMLAAFRERYPQVELRLRQADRMALLNALAQDRLDLAVVPGPLPLGCGAPALRQDALLEADFLAVLPRSHPLADRPSLQLQELSAQPFVLFPPGMQARMTEIVMAACTEAGFAPAVVQEARQLHVLLALVGAGFGVTLVPKWASRIRVSGIAYRPLRGTPPRYELLLACPVDKASPVVDNFRALALQAVQRDVTTGSGCQPANCGK